ncbi:Uncharacterized protein FWK35_00031889 [Aphis craccivora]|uniref:Uncharacterized protein n=1 Tax=Aphis craccivora TaxID=307492 RepID=A0A6G0XZR6_APHCR|nr:Uncharacterized protein FWK35_00031889 [Aphis craccivora]
MTIEIILKLCDRIQDFKYFSIAFDKSTDISDTAQLVIFVRGVNELFQITEEMLKLISLKGTTKGEDIFHAVENSLCELIWKLFLEYQLMVHLLWLAKKKEL